MNGSRQCASSVQLLLAALLLFSGSSVAQTVTPTIFDSSPNEIILSCTGVLFGDVRFTFTDPRVTNSDDPEDIIVLSASSRYTFIVTPANESTVTCANEGSDMKSSPNTFAASPTSTIETRNRNLLAFTGDNLMLSCPYELGRAENIIDPYHYVWLDEYDMEIPEERQITLNTNSSSEVYSCGINMRRCSDPELCTLVRILPESDQRVKFNIKRVERFDIVETPGDQTVNESSPVRFNCSARGSNIQIMWQFDGITVDDMDMNYKVVTNDTVPNFVRSTLEIESATIEGDITCIIHQSFNNESFDNILNYNSTSSALLSVVPMPTPTTAPPTTMASSPTSTSNEPSVNAVHVTLIVFAIVVVVAIAFIVSLVLFLYCHYHYKYKGDSSRLGRFLSRAMSRPPGKASYRSDFDGLPVDSRGHIHDSCFQSTHSINPSDSGYPQSSVRFQHGAQDQEIYHTSDNSNVSGNSYSGLSGVSNQESGVHYNMPNYAATDVSGGSANPYTSVTSNGCLAPPSSHHSNGNSRSHVPSDHTGHSRHSSNGPQLVKLTHEALIQHEQLPFTLKASSYNHIPNATQTQSAFVSVPEHPHMLRNSHQYHSDTGYVTQSNPHLERPHHSLFQATLPSPALATVEATPYNEITPPFPHGEPPPSSQAPFPNKESNNPQKLSEETIENVLDSLMHNRNCAIPNCICYSARKLYKAKMANKPKPAKVQNQTSSSSDSDSAIDKRSRLFLPLSSQDGPNLHPHFHPTHKSRARSSNPRYKLTRKRSKSLDLTPVPETSPVKSPKVGGCLVPGTPVCAPVTLEDAIAQEKQFSPAKDEKMALGPKFFGAASQRLSPCTPGCYDPNALNRLNSLSADDLPTLCLNDCPLLSTPREENQASLNPTRSASSALSTINEKTKEADSDESNTSSRSDSPNINRSTQVSSSQVVGSNSPHHVQGRRGQSESANLPYHSDSTNLPYHRGHSDSTNHTQDNRYRSVNHSITSQDSSRWNSITRESERDLSQGYQSETLSSDASLSISSLKPTPTRNFSRRGSDHSQRSASPAYETHVTVSDDGSTVQTTEC